MKHYLFLIILVAIYIQHGYTQNPEIQAQRIITIPSMGIQVEFQPITGPPSNQYPASPAAPLVPGLNWQVTDAASIDNDAKVSSQSMKTVAGWGLNDQRLSLYGSSNIPEWEVPFTITAWDEVIDMTEDGNHIANGVNDQVEVYAPGSSIPIWSTTISQAVKGIQIRDDGQQVFVAAVDQATQDSSFVYCFIVGQNTPIWVKSFAV